MLKIFKIIGLILLLFLVFNFGCPVLKLLDITCPACGVTHAWMYLLNGKIISAFNSNPLFVPLTIMFFRIIFCDIRNIKIKKTEIFIYLILSSISFVFNILRIFNWL
mgnify:FL=1